MTLTKNQKVIRVGYLIAKATVAACTKSALHINNMDVGTPHNGSGFLCGDIFSKIIDDTYDGTIRQSGPPFQITHLSDTDADESTVGFKLNYLQNGKCE